MVYLAVVRLCALIGQEAELEPAKAQVVTFKKAIDGPAADASKGDNQKENACRALVKAGEIAAPSRVPGQVLPQPQSLSMAQHTKAPILL